MNFYAVIKADDAHSRLSIAALCSANSGATAVAEKLGESRRQSISTMIKSERNSFARHWLPLLAFAVVLASCSKDEPFGVGSDGSPQVGSTKQRGLVNRIVAVYTTADQSTYTFNVSSACNCPHGSLVCSGNTQPKGSKIYEQYADQLQCIGASPGSTPPNDLYCILTRGANANTGGPQYYVKPQNNGRVLAIRIKGTTMLPDYNDWFTYNVTSNSWTANPAASTYFIWSVLSGQPTYCCGG